LSFPGDGARAERMERHGARPEAEPVSGRGGEAENHPGISEMQHPHERDAQRRKRAPARKARRVRECRERGGDGYGKVGQIERAANRGHRTMLLVRI
jgi:hypothetical protein